MFCITRSVHKASEGDTLDKSRIKLRFALLSTPIVNLRTVTVVNGSVKHIWQSLPQLRGTGSKRVRPRLIRGKSPLRSTNCKKYTSHQKSQSITAVINPFEHMSKRKWSMVNEIVPINFWEDNYETFTKSKRE